jgi:hypothetical protein
MSDLLGGLKRDFLVIDYPFHSSGKDGEFVLCDVKSFPRT